MSVKTNLLQLKANLPAGVSLVAVSKTKSVELIREAFEAGQRDFGENYVQELVDKSEHLPKEIRWHYIGHLQSNKVKYIAPFVYLIHGVDSIKLLEEINKQGIKNNRVICCLLQIFIAKEETKFGLSFDECKNLLDSENFKTLKNIQVKGLMAMASNTEDQNQIRNEFEGIHSFFNELKTKHPFMEVLSCGMSGDYQLAIEQGSNLIRVGSLIFGERNYNN